MYNWSTDEKKLTKNKDKYTIWKLEQMVNFGIGKDKIKEQELKKYWNKIDIDPFRRNFLEKLIHDTQHSH